MTPAGAGGASPDAPARALREVFASDPPDRLAVAVSGGGDSTALLHLLSRMTPETGWRLEAVTVDHGLRPEAAAEARAVAETCATLGLRHATLRWQGWDGHGNLQAAARAARYRLIADWARARGIGRVALGHTRDDNVESFVMGLARGAGLDGLSGMRPRFESAGVTFLRPLLTIGRDALRDWLAANGGRWSEDPTNDYPGFDRIRIRRALSDAGVAQDVIADAIGNLRRSRAALDSVVADWAARNVAEDRGDLVIDPGAFATLHEELARRLLNAALRWIAGADYPPRAEAVLRLTGGGWGGGTTLHGCLLRVEPRGLVIGREPEAAGRAPPVAPGAIWDGRWRLDGAAEPGAEVRAVGTAGLGACPDWRASGLPRASILASPGLWKGSRLIAAPLANLGEAWSARIDRSFAAMLAAH